MGRPGCYPRCRQSSCKSIEIVSFKQLSI